MSVVIDGNGSITGLASGGIAGAGLLDGSVTAAKMNIFRSNPITLTPAAQTTLTHGLGAKPTLVNLWLKCITAELGYSVNDEVLATSGQSRQDGSAIGQSVRRNSTQIIVRLSSSGTIFDISHATTGDASNITSANWQLIVEALG